MVIYKPTHRTVSQVHYTLVLCVSLWCVCLPAVLLWVGRGVPRLDFKLAKFDDWRTAHLRVWWTCHPDFLFGWGTKMKEEKERKTQKVKARFTIGGISRSRGRQITHRDYWPRALHSSVASNTLCPHIKYKLSRNFLKPPTWDLLWRLTFSLLQKLTYIRKHSPAHPNHSAGGEVRRVVLYLTDNSLTFR